ncbi:MAG: hypothetical protein A2Z25_24375 [Planctomycetes bacterium RBG_16_55_9]|nr:MAG: hypothetical protein A2Z25_24375 [Planctomycetes bacterium RBG_16_55_9]
MDSSTEFILSVVERARNDTLGFAIVPKRKSQIVVRESGKCGKNKGRHAGLPLLLHSIFAILYSIFFFVFFYTG